MKRLLNRLGFGWVFSSDEKIKALSLSDIEAIPLWGNFDSGFALGEYSRLETMSRKRTKVGHLVHRFNYEQDRQAGMILADLASDFINGQMNLKCSDLMLTVPPSFKSRSFDPVSLLATTIEERTNIPWVKGVLKRTKLVKPQKGIHDIELKKLNVHGAFKLARPLNLNGKKILLIDDIFDSGATLNQISVILRGTKADRVFVLVMAKTAGFKEASSSD